MKALSIRQPWAWLIVNGHKRLENRGWTHSHRGALLIHASKGMTRMEYLDARAFAHDLGVAVPETEDLDRGGFVGTCRMTGWVHQSDDPWFCGPYAFTLDDGRALPFLPWRGELGIFEAPLQALECRRHGHRHLRGEGLDSICPVCGGGVDPMA